MNLNCRERSLVAQLRMGILPINIELGRYRNIPAHERFCFNCKNVVEDEFHFMFQCPVYSDIRLLLTQYIIDSGYDV
jgi:hypothetical protein